VNELLQQVANGTVDLKLGTAFIGLEAEISNDAACDSPLILAFLMNIGSMGDFGS
jgi:hypothetical protein